MQSLKIVKILQATTQLVAMRLSMGKEHLQGPVNLNLKGWPLPLLIEIITQGAYSIILTIIIRCSVTSL